MNHPDVVETLRRQVRATEPACVPAPTEAIARGRRRLRRRRLGVTATTTALAAGAALVAVPLLSRPAGTAQPTQRIDPATTRALHDYDAQKMPALLRQHAGGVLGAYVTGLGRGTFSAGDDQGDALPRRLWNKASSMSLAYRAGGHSYSVVLLHARSEAEGDVRQLCASDVQTGYALECTVRRAADGSLVTDRIEAVRPTPDGDLAAVTRSELRTGRPVPGDPLGTPIDPKTVRIVREVKVVHSRTFLTEVTETVHAPDAAAARRLFRVPAEALTKIATDLVLVIPKPPTDKNGCPWTLPSAHVSCD